MKKILMCATLACMPLIARAEYAPVADQWNYYISANVGAFVSDVKIKDDTFFDFGGGANFEFGGKYNKYRVAFALQNRAEVSELIQILVGHTISIENIALRLNGYYDYVSGKNFAMYVGGGVGINRYDYTIQERITNITESKHGASFTGGINTGMIFSFWHLGIDLGFAIDYVSYPQIVSYGPTIGLRYNF